MTKHSESKAAKIRALLADGQKPKDIAAILDVPVTYVYGVNHYDKRKAENRISLRTGKPVRKYTRRTDKAKAKQTPVKKAEALIVLPKGQFLQLQQEIETLTARVGTVVAENTALRKEIQTLPKVIEVQVPQPFSHYTFWQRLRILFLGRAA